MFEFFAILYLGSTSDPPPWWFSGPASSYIDAWLPLVKLDMSQLREISYDCARYLVEHPNELLHRLPTTLVKAAIYLTNAGVVQYTQHAIEGLEYLASVMPRSMVIDKDSSGAFLNYYDVDALKDWIDAAVATTALETGLALKPSSNSLVSTISSTQTEMTSTDVADPIALLLEELNPKRVASLEMLFQELNSLLLSPSALTRETRLAATEATPSGEFILICNNEKCTRTNRCGTKLHFDRIVNSTTDASLGDCSYLDTCYKGRSCKYVHYKVLLPTKPTVYRTPNFGQPSPCQIRPQYIQCDIRELDFPRLGGNYAAIIVDPPWDIHMNSQSSTAEPSITDNEILGLDVGSLQEEGVLFLWVTGRVLDLGRRCLQQWGYGHIEELVWCKTNQLGRTICTGRTGHWINHSKEHCLVGLKGNPTWIKRNVDVDVIVSTTRGRSQKPLELYGIIDRMVGPNSKKIELFGRMQNVRPGWLTVGKELPGMSVFDPQLAKIKISK